MRAGEVPRAVKFLEARWLRPLQEVLRGWSSTAAFTGCWNGSPFAEGIDQARRFAILAWRDRIAASRAMFEIDHREDSAELNAPDRGISWAGSAGRPAA